MANNGIRDSQLNASSSHPRYSYTMGRLNLTGDQVWRVGEGDTSPWLQVDFLMFTKISGIITQGQNYGGTSFVIKYKISYCNNGVDFQKYREYGHEKVSEVGSMDPSLSGQRSFIGGVKPFISGTKALHWGDKGPSCMIGRAKVLHRLSKALHQPNKGSSLGKQSPFFLV